MDKSNLYKSPKANAAAPDAGVSSKRVASYADKLAEKEERWQTEAGALTGRRRLWLRFLTGLVYTAFIANFFSLGTDSTFFFAFVAVLGIFVIYSGLGIWWLTLWAKQKDARPGQFGIGSLLLVTVWVAIFLNTVRWIVVRASEQSHEAFGVDAFCKVALICLVLACSSIPFVLSMSEAVLWAAVWLINRPRVRQWLRGRKKRDHSSPGSEVSDK